MDTGWFMQMQPCGHKPEMRVNQVPSLNSGMKTATRLFPELNIRVQSWILTCDAASGHAEQVLYNVTL